MANSKASSLDYFISEKDAYLVVSFLGAVTKTTALSFEKCILEISKSEAKFIVLTFHDVNQFDSYCIAPLIKLEKTIRDKPAELRLCFIRPDLQKMLIEAGAIRPQEIVANLVEALTSFGPAHAKAS